MGIRSLVLDYGHYHPANWINDHQAAAVSTTATCRTCHEISLVKAGSGVPNCLTSACHHGSTPGWANADLHGARAKWGVGTPGGSFAATYANSEQAAVGCHANGPGAVPHPIPFLDVNHTTVTQAQFNGNCAACHVVSGTSPVSAAPACRVCHQAALGGAPHRRHEGRRLCERGVGVPALAAGLLWLGAWGFCGKLGGSPSIGRGFRRPSGPRWAGRISSIGGARIRTWRPA